LGGAKNYVEGDDIENLVLPIGENEAFKNFEESLKDK
jgi:hypothetical protein